jgi:hypothetical protein
MLVLLTLLLAADRQIVTTDDPVALRAFVQGVGGHVRSCPFEQTCIVEGALNLGGLPFVAHAEPDLLTHAPLTFSHYTVSTDDCGPLWELNALNIESVWTKVKGDAAPLISVMDSGFRTSHPDLAGRIAGQWDHGEDDPIANVVWSGLPHHGTFIMGLIAALHTNAIGRAGLAPLGRLFAQKIADDDGALYFSYAIEALAAVANGSVPARIVNYSLSSSNPPAAFHQAIAALDAAGAILVTAASNCATANCWDANNDEYPLYPASSDGAHVLTVAASGPSGSFNPYSHYGPESVDLAAPGVDLCSFNASNDDGVLTASGTSYAAPLVAAAAALVWEAHPDLSHHEVVRLVKASAEPSKPWRGKVLSGGVLDVEALVQTPLVRITQTNDTELALRNVAGAGKVVIVFFHDTGVELERPSGINARPFAKNELLSLPGLARAPSAGTLWTVEVTEHAKIALALSRKDSANNTAVVSARAIALGQALGIAAPRLGEAGVTADASGAASFILQLPSSVQPAQQERGDPPPDLESPTLQSEPPSTVAKPATTKPVPSNDGVDASAPSGCQSSGAPWPFVTLLASFLRRRRAR